MKLRLFYIILLILLIGTVRCQYDLLKKRFILTYTNPYCSWCKDNQVDEIQFIPSKTIFIRMFSPADPDLLADFLWMRTSYYFGSHTVTDQDYFYLYYLLSRITDLSPKWEFPYVMGGIILFLEAQAPKQALAIIEKGISQIKNSWELFFLKGYILWKAYNNYEEASKQILSASLKKEAPSYLPLLAATFSLKTSNKIFIKGFYKIILNTVKDPAQKQLILKKMKRLKERDGYGDSIE